MARIGDIIEQAAAGERIAPAEGLMLLEQADLLDLARGADARRRALHPDGIVSFIIDRNISYTNICVARCKFCAFYRRPGDPEGYVLPLDVILKKIEETVELGGTGILMQGGMHPELKIDYYENLLGAIRERFSIQLHCFSPPEIVVIARLSKLSIRETVVRLKAAGLGSIPGGGAEILDEERRRWISPGKCSAAEWLEVMREAHLAGLKSTATMMFGMGETSLQRVEHLESLRRLQDETGGFVAFIPWNFQAANTDMQDWDLAPVTGHEYLRHIAVARLYLDNIPNLQASWLTQGLMTGQIALRFGANDLGSVMIEENVISQAGAHHTATRDQLIGLIRQAGFTPAQRDATYQFRQPIDHDRRYLQLAGSGQSAVGS